MIAIGNDVVDLAESPRNGDSYYQRLISYALVHSEYRFLEENNAQVMLRLLWAIKEASYKSSNKSGNLERFNPKNFLVSEIKRNGRKVAGRVLFRESEMRFIGKVTEDLVHVIAFKEDSDFHFREGKIESAKAEQQSLAVRNLLGEYLEEEYSIRKDDNGIPWLYYAKKKREISLSHHGRFGAWAIAK